MGGAPLASTFPGLFSLAMDKEAKVKVCLEFRQGKVVWCLQFRRELKDWMLDSVNGPVE